MLIFTLHNMCLLVLETIFILHMIHICYGDYDICQETGTCMYLYRYFSAAQQISHWKLECHQQMSPLSNINSFELLCCEKQQQNQQWKSQHPECHNTLTFSFGKIKKKEPDTDFQTKHASQWGICKEKKINIYEKLFQNPP